MDLCTVVALHARGAGMPRLAGYQWHLQTPSLLVDESRGYSRADQAKSILSPLLTCPPVMMRQNTPFSGMMHSPSVW